MSTAAAIEVSRRTTRAWIAMVAETIWGALPVSVYPSVICSSSLSPFALRLLTSGDMFVDLGRKV